MTIPPHYDASAGRLERLLQRGVAWLTRHGVTLFGTRLLAVRGRTSGEWRTVPLNPMDHEGHRYLVAPRGHTQWVRNLRASGQGELRLGRRVEQFTAVELGDEEKVGVLREYLRRWSWEVGRFFGGVDASASDHAILRIAPRHPVFVITPVGAARTT